MTNKFEQKIPPAPWEMPKNRFGEILTPVFVVKNIEETEEIKSLHHKELIFNLLADDEMAFLAIPEMLAVVRAARIYVENIEHFDEKDLRRKLLLLERYIKELDEKHGTEDK